MESIGARQKLDLVCLRRKVSASPAVENLFLSITSRCDLSCRHCWYRNEKKTPDMPLTMAIRLINQAAVNKIPQITFFGGEPSLYPSLEKLISKAAGLGLFTELDTNGQKLSTGGIKRLVRAGLSSVMVSLHSYIPGEHDMLTGEIGSHRKAVSFLKEAFKAGLICYVSVCFFGASYSVNKLSSFASFCRRLGVHGIRSLFFCGGGASYSPAIDLTAKIKKLGLEEYVRDCFSISPDKRFCAGVSGKILYVDATGEVKGCPYSLTRLGNLRSRTLSSFVKRSAAKTMHLLPPCLP